MNKRFLAILLAAALAVMLLPAAASATVYNGDITTETHLTEDSIVPAGATVTLVKVSGPSNLCLDGSNLINRGTITAGPEAGSIDMHHASPSNLYNYGNITCNNIERIQNGYIFNYNSGVISSYIARCKVMTIYNYGMIGEGNQNMKIVPYLGEPVSVVIHNYGTIKGNIDSDVGDASSIRIYNHADGKILSDMINQNVENATPVTIYNYSDGVITTDWNGSRGDVTVYDENKGQQCPPIPVITIEDIPAQPDQDGTGTAKRVEPPVTVKHGDKTLTPGTDYIVTYENNTGITGSDAIAHVNFTGAYEQAGTMAKPFTIAKNVATWTMLGPIPAQTYTGTAIEPDVLVRDSNGSPLEKGKDYELTYSNNTNAADATDPAPPTVTVTGKGDYAGTESKPFTIQRAPLTVTAEDKTRAYGEMNPAFTVSSSGFVNGEKAADVLGGTLQFACVADASSAVGEYAITPSGLTAANYDITYIAGKLRVTRKGAQGAAEPASPAVSYAPTYTYNVIQGANGSWTKGGGGLRFVSNGPHGGLRDVAVDGTLIGGDKYTEENGGTAVTLNASYLETLPAGKHTLRMNFMGGYADTTFTIGAAPGVLMVDVPATGGREAAAFVWFLCGACCLVARMVLRKRREDSSSLRSSE